MCLNYNSGNGYFNFAVKLLSLHLLLIDLPIKEIPRVVLNSVSVEVPQR